MRPHEIREIFKIGWVGEKAGETPHTIYWKVKFRRYGIVDANDYIDVVAKDEVEAFQIATKRLETYR